MRRPPLIKLTVRETALYFADLWLVSEGSIEWVKEMRVRRVWYVAFFSAIGLLVVRFLGYTFVSHLTEESRIAAEAFRLCMVLGTFWLIVCEATLGGVYYRYLLATGRDLRFRNIAIFWASWVVLFDALYTFLYVWRPGLFLYQNAPFIPGPVMRSLSTSEMLRAYADFLVYSACTAAAVPVPGLSAASRFVSALNLIEVLGFVLLVALCVATFIAKSKKV